MKQGRVLLVEDNRALAENVAEILQDEGAEVRRAESGVEGRHMAHQPFDVALVEVRLPDASGLELLSTLKASGDGMGEVLLVTGHGSLEDAIAALERGAHAYLLKPFQTEDLVKSMERALRQVRSSRRAKVLARKLEQKEASLRTLVDTVQALLLVLDEEGRVVQANPAVEAATGVPAEELMGSRWVERFVLEADRKETHEAIARLRAGEQRISHENRIVGRCRSGSDGGERWIRWQAAAHPTGNGEVWVYASGLDSTDVRDLERRTRLSERLAAVGTLTAGLAHEVRNPLNAAKLQLDLLERRAERSESPADIAEPLHLVRGEIRRLADLLDEFLEFARPMELSLEESDLRELARQTLEMEGPDAEAREIELKLEVPDDPVVIFADRGKLRQVLLNLVRNAIEAMGAAGRVTLRVEPDGQGARVTVRDTGPGIPDEVLSRLFEPFFSTKAGGTGLGLAICHSLIAQHGGDIRVVSGGESTEFGVTLPRRPPGWFSS